MPWPMAPMRVAGIRNAIVKGERAVTADTALRLARFMALARTSSNRHRGLYIISKVPDIRRRGVRLARRGFSEEVLRAPDRTPIQLMGHVA
jgi:hypothetical protein